jgi:DNA-binding NtrC family response regulator
LRQSVERSDKEIGKISVDAMQSLQAYRWPGNVRELENVIERAVVLATGETITARELPPKILGEVFYLAENQEGQDLIALPYQDAKDKALLAFNRNYVMGLLRRSGGNLSLASNKAGMDRSNFKKIVKKSAINVKEFKKGLLE